MQQPFTAIAAANGTATVTVPGPTAGLMWVMPQFSIETTPFRVGSTATARRNGRFVTSSSLGSGDTAYGPPALVLYENDVFTVAFAGLTAGDQVVVTLFYKEQPWNANPDPNVVV